MKKVILLTPLLFLALHAMDSKLQPFQAGSITTIPAYLFANPNPGDLRTWDAAKLARLREQAGKATKKAIKHHFPNAQDAAEHAKAFDWLHCLNFAERAILQATSYTPITSLRTLQFLNALMTRLTSTSQGNLRTTNKIIRLKEKTPTSSAFALLFPMLPDLFTFNSEQATYTIPATTVKSYLASLSDTGINPEVVHDWLEEQGKDRNDLNGLLCLEAWLRNQKYECPAVNMAQVSTTIGCTSQMPSPLKVAATLWYSLLKMHSFNDLNDETTRAAVALHLLQSGYLPPEIGPDDKAAYDAAQKAVLLGDDFTVLEDLLKKLVRKTQDKYHTEAVS